VSFKVGDYVAFIGSKQISIVLDFDGVNYRTRVIRTSSGNPCTIDSQEDYWHKLRPEHVRVLTSLEMELL
jgi:hypothetical protein